MHQMPESRSDMQALLCVAIICFIGFQSGKAQGMLFDQTNVGSILTLYVARFSNAARLLCLSIQLSSYSI